MNENPKLKLHYSFDDNSHSMDAITRNKCEREFLYLVSEIANELKVEIKIETEAYEEGGLQEIWTFIGENSGQISLLISAVLLVLELIPKRNKKLDKLREEYLKLGIEEKKLRLLQLKIELQDHLIENAEIVTDKLEIVAENNYKIIKHKSNFFKNLLHYPKVTKVSTEKVNYVDKSKDKKVEIERPAFQDYILETDDLKPIIDPDASIEIISPVLKKGRYKWKGTYKDESIEFYMRDHDFKEEVIQRGLSFKNGTTISCTLEVSRKIDDLGEIKKTSYSVMDVLSVEDSGVIYETPKAKRIRNIKEADRDQMRLF